jgi:hypothetical protein
LDPNQLIARSIDESEVGRHVEITSRVARLPERGLWETTLAIRARLLIHRESVLRTPADKDVRARFWILRSRLVRSCGEPHGLIITIGIKMV